MYNFGVVILNYLAYKDTINCVESFKKQIEIAKNDIRVKIIIVDNFSSNESFDELNKKYKDDNLIEIVQTEKNLGFANGNNFGYYELQKYMKPDFVIFSNDDILIDQAGIFDWIIDTYKNENFAVLGPSIYSIRGNFHQSPCENKSYNTFLLKKELIGIRLGLLKLYLKKVFHISQKTAVSVWENNNFDKQSTSLTLHGSFQIMSRLYLDLFNDPYDNRTFLYREENILKLRCDKNNLKMLYDPNFEVNHLQAVSTEMKLEKNIDKLIFRTKNEIKSQKILIKVCKEEK